MKRILILYTSVGLGHKVIAENIGFYLQQAGYEISLADVLEVQAGPLVTVTTWAHQQLNIRLPGVWKWLYTSPGFTKFSLPKRVKVAARRYHQTKAVIDRFQPDLVISTQTTASGIVEFLKASGMYAGKFAVAFSDYHLHRWWLYDHVDLYLANTEEQKQEMVALGVASEKIAIVGMALKPKPEINTVSVRRKLGLADSDRVILVSSGSLGTQLSPKWLKILVDSVMAKAALSPDHFSVKFAVVAGKNEPFYQELKQVFANDSNVLVFGYYEPLAELYAISSLYITKPGGLSVAESLQWRLPLLITHWLPGQEELNYQYLYNKGLIMPVKLPVEHQHLAETILTELRERSFRASLEYNPEIVRLLQENKAENGVVKAVQKLFHSV